MVRAGVVDRVTHTVIRVLDWRVRGDGQYLWRLPGGHVLLHTDHELRELDAELKPERSLPVAGRLAWVVLSPSGEYTAVGVLRERYSLQTRHDLEQVLPDEAEEDVEVQVFNKTAGKLLTAIRSSKMPAPVLSDAGELRVSRQKGNRWLLREVRWDRTEHDIVSLHSSCRPTFSAPVSKLIFVLGCTGSGGLWYRMLRDDGHPVLKAEYLPGEIEHAAEADAPGSFAVRVVQTDKPLLPGQPFRPSDLLAQSVSLYRTSNGVRVDAITSPDFILSQLGFALSPAGDEMAIAEREGIAFYSLHPASPAGTGKP